MKSAQKLVCASLSWYFERVQRRPKARQAGKPVWFAMFARLVSPCNDVDNIKQIVVGGPSGIRGYPGLVAIYVLAGAGAAARPYRRGRRSPAEQLRVVRHQVCSRSMTALRIGLTPAELSALMPPRDLDWRVVEDGADLREGWRVGRIRGCGALGKGRGRCKMNPGRAILDRQRRERRIVLNDAEDVEMCRAQRRFGSGDRC